MQNSLPDLEEEDRRYNLHVGAEPIDNYNITLIYPDWKPHPSMLAMVPLHPPEKIRANLEKLGIFF